MRKDALLTCRKVNQQRNVTKDTQAEHAQRKTTSCLVNPLYPFLSVRKSYLYASNKESLRSCEAEVDEHR